MNHEPLTMNYLIAGLGNIGPEYADTRHNIGFMILDELVKQGKAQSFTMTAWPIIVKLKHKARTLYLQSQTNHLYEPER